MELSQNLAHVKQLIVLNIFNYDYCVNHNHNKILKSDWLSTAPISA